LMSDPRVVRGSTHSLARKITLSKNELSKSQTIMQRTRTVVHEPPSQPTYSFEVKPFSNNEIDVSTYLVQQTDYRPQKKALDTQTDVFIPRPDTPDYVPAKIGVDTGTQVEDVRDLFNFDTEVTPIVEVIAQKTIDQALFELSSEEELKNLETAARDFRTEKFRNEEWMRNRENQAIKENKQRRERIIQLQTARENEKRTKTIVAGVQMMRQTFPHAFESVCDGLVSSGVWQETDNAIAEKDFIPVVMEQASRNVDAHIIASEALDGELKAVISCVLETSVSLLVQAKRALPITLSVVLCHSYIGGDGGEIPHIPRIQRRPASAQDGAGADLPPRPGRRRRTSCGERGRGCRGCGGG